MSYAIICDAREGIELGIDTLALVDRSKTKKYWWTSDNVDIILNYKKRSAAEYACKRLKKNNARVVDSLVAFDLIQDQCDNINEPSWYEGWQGHKET